jgi:hypothetical protein
VTVGARFFLSAISTLFEAAGRISRRRVQGYDRQSLCIYGKWHDDSPCSTTIPHSSLEGIYTVIEAMFWKLTYSPVSSNSQNSFPAPSLNDDDEEHAVCKHCSIHRQAQRKQWLVHAASLIVAVGFFILWVRPENDASLAKKCHDLYNWYCKTVNTHLPTFRLASWPYQDCSCFSSSDLIAKPLPTPRWPLSPMSRRHLKGPSGTTRHSRALQHRRSRRPGTRS